MWFNGRAEPLRVRREVLALVAPSIWMAKKTSLLSSDLRPQTRTETGRVSLFLVVDFRDRLSCSYTDDHRVLRSFVSGVGGVSSPGAFHVLQAQQVDRQ